MRAQFAKRGAQIDAIYYCPFHPEHGIGKYHQDNVCRKPAPGMLLQAQKDLDIDLICSVLVGDKLSDIQAGESAGVGTLIYYGERSDVEGCIQVSRLSQAISYLKTVGI